MSQPINAQLLRSLCDLLAWAESNGPIDFTCDEEREAYERAVAAKKEASEPCPLCTSAEQLCEACGGHGVVPKAMSLQVLEHGEPTDKRIPMSVDVNDEGIIVSVGEEDAYCKVWIEHNDGRVSVLIVANEGNPAAMIDVDPVLDEESDMFQANVRLSTHLCDIEEVAHV